MEKIPEQLEVLEQANLKKHNDLKKQLQKKSRKCTQKTLTEISNKLDKLIDAFDDMKIDREKLKENLREANPAEAAVTSQMESITQFVKDMHAATLKDSKYNDYVYYRIFSLISM